MFIRIFFIIILFACETKSTAEDQSLKMDILERLRDIPGLTVKEIEKTAHFERVFEVYISQAVDHMNKKAATFQQKIYIGHVDDKMPVSLETEGYARAKFKLRELSKLMRCNQITVEHRYNGSSKPSPLDWKYLTIKQAADDLHEIVQKLKQIYSGKWVSSGRSKGGETAIFYRRYYPNDVDATVAYVAPILFQQDDKRFSQYLETVGDESCRNKIKSFQREVLMNVDSLADMILPYTSWINQAYNTNFKYSISTRSVIKHAAIDYPFEFWSSTKHSCSSIPVNGSGAKKLFNHLTEVVDFLLFYTDYGLNFWEAWYYQAQTEIGDYKVDISGIKDLLGEVEVLHGFSSLTFNSSVMKDIDDWIKKDGDKILLIYGKDDPWSVAQFDISAKDMLKIINPGTKHETSILDLNSSDQNIIKSKLSSWLNYSDFAF